MISRLPNPVWLRTFEIAARLLNFTEAGRELGLTQTAVSLHIKSLEATLGCQLFLRNPRHLELTAMGQAYLHGISKALGDMELATINLFGHHTKQTITVRAPVSTATFWLASQLPEFTRLHTGIDVRLISTIWANSIAEEDVDVDLRIGHGDWHGIEVEKISTETIVPICAANTAMMVNQPHDLLKGSHIHILGYENNWAQYLTSHGLGEKQSENRYSVDTSAAAISLTAGGGGYAVVMTRFAEFAAQNGFPIAIVGKPITVSQAHYVTSSHTHVAPRPEAQMFKSWLKSRFAVGTS